MLRLTQILGLAILIFIVQKHFFTTTTPTLEPAKKEITAPVVEEVTILTPINEASETVVETIIKPSILKHKLTNTDEPHELRLVETEPIMEQLLKVEAEPSVEPQVTIISCPGFGRTHYTPIEKEELLPMEEMKEKLVEPIAKALPIEEPFNTPKTIECRVYPNPATEYITVELSDIAETTMNLINSNGQLVWSSITQDQTTVVDLQDYPAGVYYLQVVSGEQKMVKSVVVQ